GDVRFVVRPARQLRNRPPRHQLADEGDAAPHFVANPPARVEAQVHFGEVAVIWNRDAAHARPQKLEADDADQRGALPEIEGRAGRDERYEQGRVDAVIQHRQVVPLSRQEWPRHQASCYNTRIRSDRVMMNVLSVLKSRTSTAGFCGVIIVDSSSTGVETSTNGNAGCMIDSTGCAFTSGSRTSSS